MIKKASPWNGSKVTPDGRRSKESEEKMRLKKRIEALELAEAQRSCSHHISVIKVSKSNGVNVKVEATCAFSSCKKHFERVLIGEEICAASLLLWEQIEPK